MGGARCSYRTCTQKSDQVTHMFHFPVFDKVRCHQWITNAQKQDYFNLKLSQLKNRVICQHHFTDDCFMNGLKKKLKITAIPTLNGPLCTADESMEEIQNKQGTELPINIDDIENEFLAKSDKRAHFSVKYGDFLINDFPEGITLDLNPYSAATIKREDTKCNRFDKKSNLHNSNKYIHNSNKTVVKKNVSPKKPRVIANSKILPKINKELPSSPKVVSIEFEELNLYPTKQDKMTQPNQSITSIQPNTLQPNTLQPNLDNITVSASHNNQLNESIPNKTKKVKIISEKLISEPVKISKGELQPVSPSIIINVPNKKNKHNMQKIETVYLDKILPMQNEQLFQNSSNMSMQVGAQLDLQEYGQPTMIIDQSSCLNNNQTLEDTTCSDAKPMNYVTSDAYQNNQMLKQETEMFSNIENNMSTVPNVEFVSSSLTGPSVFTLVNVPPVTIVNESNFAEELSLSQVDLKNVSLPTKSIMVSTDQVPALITLNDSLNKAKNEQSNVYQKQITSKSSSPSKSLVRAKMSPEKLAAIERKRKYNMKLRDIIHSCLNNMDEEPDIGKLTMALKKEIGNKKVGDHLEEVPSQPYNVIAYFENRLKRMEDLLSNKIEHNSLKIADLKKTVKGNTSKKSVSTQTYQNAEETKKSLYQQLSQYLSSEANSLIYEELFINQCVLKKDSFKKRKLR